MRNRPILLALLLILALGSSPWILAAAPPGLASVSGTFETGWFSGAINDNLKIHLKLSGDGERISGVYYYDKYQKNIALSGEIYNKLFTVNEKNLKGTITGIFVSADLIEGIWSDEKQTYPLYLIKEGSAAAIPQKPDPNTMRWEGSWDGKDSGYYGGSVLIVQPIFNNLIKFEFIAHNGLHTGGFSSVALLEKNIAIFIDKNPYGIKGEEIIKFTFTLTNNDEIKVDTNDYSYMCGMGVGYDSLYTEKPLKIKTPTAQEVGLVYTADQERIFKKLTGDYYETFIRYAGFYFDKADLDGLKAMVRSFGIRGYANASIVMIIPKDNTIMAAISLDGVHYFTNNKKYTKPPQTIRKWYAELGATKIITTVKQIKI